jgi:signal peptidase II
MRRVPLRPLVLSAWTPALVVGVALAVLVLDQAVKAWVERALPLEVSRPFLPPVLWLTHTRNTGAAFSLLRGHGEALILISIIIITFMAVSLARLARRGERAPGLLGIGLALPLGGALGNLVDRLARGFVVDYLDLRWWPIFNIADSAIVVGAIFLAFHLLRAPAGSTDASPVVADSVPEPAGE